MLCRCLLCINTFHWGSYNILVSEYWNTRTSFILHLKSIFLFLSMDIWKAFTFPRVKGDTLSSVKYWGKERLQSASPPLSSSTTAATRCDRFTHRRSKQAQQPPRDLDCEQNVASERKRQREETSLALHLPLALRQHKWESFGGRSETRGATESGGTDVRAFYTQSLYGEQKRKKKKNRKSVNAVRFQVVSLQKTKLHFS